MFLSTHQKRINVHSKIKKKVKKLSNYLQFSSSISSQIQKKTEPSAVYIPAS